MNKLTLPKSRMIGLEEFIDSPRERCPPFSTLVFLGDENLLVWDVPGVGVFCLEILEFFKSGSCTSWLDSLA